MTVEQTTDTEKWHIPTTAELLARLPDLFHLGGSGRAIEPKASDLSPYIPRPTVENIKVKEETKTTN